MLLSTSQADTSVDLVGFIFSCRQARGALRPPAMLEACCMADPGPVSWMPVFLFLGLLIYLVEHILQSLPDKRVCGR